MHLSGKSDAGDFISARSQGVERVPNRQSAGAPSVARILFRPSQLRRCEWRVLCCAGCGDPAVFISINDESAGSAGADVDPEKLDAPSPLRDFPRRRCKPCLYGWPIEATHLAEVFDEVGRRALQPNRPLQA